MKAIYQHKSDDIQVVRVVVKITGALEEDQRCKFKISEILFCFVAFFQQRNHFFGFAIIVVQCTAPICHLLLYLSISQYI